MRILAFTDLHAKERAYEKLRKKAEQCDCVICAGDFTIFGKDWLKMGEKLSRLGKPVFLVHGNHESEEIINRIARLHKNIIPVHKRVVRFNNITIFGYGGLGFISDAPEFERVLKAADKQLREAENLIFVTHQPPYGTIVDFIYDEYVGNKSFTQFDRRYKPLIHICGHIEENSFKREMLGRTLLINPGDEGRILVIRP
jgi:Icc-related predicted phosphoesterase